MSMKIMRVLEEYGKWKAEALTINGLDSKEVIRLSEEIADRLERMGSGYQPRQRSEDEHHVEEKHLSHGLIRQDIRDKDKMEVYYSRGRRGETSKILFRDSRNKRSMLKALWREDEGTLGCLS